MFLSSWFDIHDWNSLPMVKVWFWELSSFQTQKPYIWKFDVGSVFMRPSSSCEWRHSATHAAVNRYLATWMTRCLKAFEASQHVIGIGQIMLAIFRDWLVIYVNFAAPDHPPIVLKLRSCSTSFTKRCLENNYHNSVRFPISMQLVVVGEKGRFWQIDYHRENVNTGYYENLCFL